MTNNKKPTAKKILSIQEKLSDIQSELKAPKKQYNAFAKFSYRSCEDILEAVKPILKYYRTTLIISDKISMIGERFYVRAIVTLIDLDDNMRNEISVTAYAREEESKKGMDGSQITGAASSYARKYALNGLFGIDDAKDSDTTNKGEVVKKVVVKPLSDKEIKAISGFLQKIIDAKTTEDLDKVAGLIKRQNFNPSQQRVLKTSWLAKVKKVSK